MTVLAGHLLSKKKPFATSVETKSFIEHFGTASGFVTTPGPASKRRYFALPPVKNSAGPIATKGEVWITSCLSTKSLTPKGAYAPAVRKPCSSASAAVLGPSAPFPQVSKAFSQFAAKSFSTPNSDSAACATGTATSPIPITSATTARRARKLELMNSVPLFPENRRSTLDTHKARESRGM